MELVVALLLGGALLFVVEIFLPGLIAAKFGILMLLAAVAFGYLRLGTSGGSWTLLAASAILGLGGVIYFRFFGHSAAATSLISPGSSATPPPPHRHLIGRMGRSVTSLHPEGVAQFGEERVDVVSEGASLEPGQAVRAIGVEGSRVVVRPA